ncbi:MAG: InlB B-repeat-containing protein [Bacilli bacterium]|nr:InlB B-repeat-containing protein [Bacilli bacterium]
MKRKKLNKKFIIIVLILFISIGFAYLTSNLNITGLATLKRSVWDVHFENIVNENENVLSINTPAKITNNKLRVDFEVSLDQPGEEYSFYVDVLNNSTFDVALDTLTVSGLTSTQEQWIIPTVTYRDGITPLHNDILKENSLETLRVSVKYNDDLTSNNLPNIDNDFTLTVELKYNQADSNSKERTHLEYVNRQTTGVISVGDEIAIDTEHFYVVSSDEDKTVLLAKYNLNVGAYTVDGELGIQNENAKGYTIESEPRSSTIAFSNISYFSNGDGSLKNEYGSSYDHNNVYDSEKGIATKEVKKYRLYLEELGLRILKERLITFDELIDLGCQYTASTSTGSCNSVSQEKNFINTNSYWTATASDSEGVKVVRNGSIYNNAIVSNTYNGVRPVIELNTDFLKNNGYKILFDSNGGDEATPSYAYKDKDSKIIDDYFDVFIVDENTNGYGASWSASNMSFTKIVDSSSPTGMALHTERVADGTTGGGTFGLSLIEGEYYRETYIYKAYGNWSIGHYRLGRMNAPNTEEYKTITHAAKATNNRYQTITNYDYNTTAGDTFDLAYGKVTHLLPETKRTGYTFAGWWTEKDGGTRISNTTKVTGNKIYYAHWTEN